MYFSPLETPPPPRLRALHATAGWLQVPRGASKSKPLRYEVSQRELEEMMREQG